MNQPNTYTLTGLFGLPETLLSKNEMVYLQNLYHTNNNCVFPDVTQNKLLLIIDRLARAYHVAELRLKIGDVIEKLRNINLDLDERRKLVDERNVLQARLKPLLPIERTTWFD